MANENKPKNPPNVGDKAKELVQAVGQKADDAASAVGDGVKSLGDKLRESGPQEGMLGAASSAVAGALERGGGYLQEQGLSGMADDLIGLIKKNPVPAVLIGVGIGFLLARATRS
jgi:hypothetical protein